MDASGSLDKGEVNLLMMHIGMDISQLDKFFSTVDEDNSGVISFKEFYGWILKDREFKMTKNKKVCQEKA